MTNVQTELYLKRINADFKIEKNKTTLDRLQKAHISNVPYENLEILKMANDFKPAINLDENAVFDRIVNNRRGGYCFDLNGLFGKLLTSLGFEVENYAARFVYGEKTIPMRRHRVLKVKADDGIFLCDVGVGIEAPRMSLILEENTKQDDGFCVYYFKKDTFYGWTLYRQKGDENPEPFFAFTEEPQVDIDYLTVSYFCEKHPDSIFNKKEMLSIKTENGRKTIDGNIFKIFDHDTLIQKAELKNSQEQNEIYKKEFGIDLN